MDSGVAGTNFPKEDFTEVKEKALSLLNDSHTADSAEEKVGLILSFLKEFEKFVLMIRQLPDNIENNLLKSQVQLYVDDLYMWMQLNDLPHHKGGIATKAKVEKRKELVRTCYDRIVANHPTDNWSKVIRRIEMSDEIEFGDKTIKTHLKVFGIDGASHKAALDSFNKNGNS